MESKLRPLAPIGIYRDIYSYIGIYIALYIININLYSLKMDGIGSIWAQVGPKWAQSEQRGPKVGPKWAQVGPSGPKWAQSGPKWAQSGPKWALYIINIRSSGLSFDSIYGIRVSGRFRVQEGSILM